jgi:hypothetical protein
MQAVPRVRDHIVKAAIIVERFHPRSAWSGLTKRLKAKYPKPDQIIQHMAIARIMAHCEYVKERKRRFSFKQTPRFSIDHMVEAGRFREDKLPFRKKLDHPVNEYI